jgi:hypothetical protein
VKRFLLILFLLLAVACGPAAVTEDVGDVGETAVSSPTDTTTDQEASTGTENAEQPADTAEETEPQPEEEPTTAPEPTDEPEATDEPVLEEETAATDSQSFASDFSPSTTVTEAAEIRSQDWTKGAEDPRITIIEYGDFQ